jgi:O-antigen/teichoic acid export membrane protein
MIEPTESTERAGRAGRPAIRWLSFAPGVGRPVAGSMAAGLVIQVALVGSGIVVARMLGVESRGELALMTLFPAVLTQLGGSGIPTAVTYFIAKYPPHVRAIMRLVLPVLAAQIVILTLLHVAIVSQVFTQQSPAITLAAVSTLVAVPAILAQQVGLAILQGLKVFRDFNILRVAPVVSYSACALVIFVSGTKSISLVAASWAISWVVVAFATWRRVYRAVECVPTADVDASLISRRGIYTFGLKSVLGWASPVEVLRLDQAVVGLFLSTASLGLYVVALSFTNLARFVAQSVGMVGYPHIAAETSYRAAKRSMWSFVALAAAICSAVVLVLELFAGDLVPFFFGAAFTDAVGLTRLLMVATLVTSVRRVLGEGARGTGHPTLGSYAETLSWLVLVPALALLTPAYGTTGVALGLIAAGLTSLLILVVLVIRAKAPGDLPSRIRPHADVQTQS